jgi:hypothetical protein
MYCKLGLGISAVLLVVGSTANAQRAPDTATMDRGDGVTRIGFDFGLTLADKPPAPYDAALRVEAYGQYVTNSGLGIYGSLPVAHSFGGDGPPMPDDATALGNVELGGLYVLSGDSLSWVFRGGVALPTASDSVDGVPTNAVPTPPRLTDTALARPDALYLRFGTTPLVHANKLFLQADLGADVGIGIGDGSKPDHFLRFNLGGGIDLGFLELVNLAQIDDDDDNEQFVHALSFTMRFMGKALQPVIAVGSPLDDSGRAQVKLYAAVGIQIVFR